MQRFVRYLVAAAPDLPLADFHAILAEASAEDVMPTIAEELRNQGRAEGRAEGRADALRATVRRQLQVKFGDLGEATEKRLNEASADELEQFLDRIVVADSIESVLGPDA
jgi:predicted transposase YdaD